VVLPNSGCGIILKIAGFRFLRRVKWSEMKELSCVVLVRMILKYIISYWFARPFVYGNGLGPLVYVVCTFLRRVHLFYEQRVADTLLRTVSAFLYGILRKRVGIDAGVRFLVDRCFGQRLRHVTPSVWYNSVNVLLGGT
jgi:hypothetical protein